ncbi:MAG: diaminopimelate epimerase [Polyangiaceae bacterium]
MAELAFTKYEGLGNDFLVVDVESSDALGPADAERLCDRHRGVGGDGVLLVAPGSSPGASARMVVLNADGSRPEMCGNGIRCVALHLARRDSVRDGSILVDTDAGLLGCAVSTGDFLEAMVGVDMGRGVAVGQYASLFRGEEIVFAQISMGNPHAIVFGRDYSLAEIDSFGAQVNGEVPGGTNVEFAQQLGPQSIDLVVFERGVGRTLACGTGACATAVAAALAGQSPFDAPIEVRLPGGPLEIRVAQADLAVHMRGPARLVFSGTISPGLGLRAQGAAPQGER